MWVHTWVSNTPLFLHLCTIYSYVLSTHWLLVRFYNGLCIKKPEIDFVLWPFLFVLNVKSISETHLVFSLCTSLFFLSMPHFQFYKHQNKNLIFSLQNLRKQFQNKKGQKKIPGAQFSVSFSQLPAVKKDTKTVHLKKNLALNE